MTPITLRGLTWDDPRGYGPLRAVHRAFCAEHPELPLAIEWDIQPLGGFESRSLEELVDDYDLVVADHPHVLEAARQGCLLPAEGCDEGFVGLSRESYTADGECWAFPVDAACHVAAYRRELFASDDSLMLPTLWDEVEPLVDAGVRVAVPLAGVHAAMALITLVASQPDAQNEQVLNLTPERLTAGLQRLKELMRLVARESLQWNPLDALQALADGRVDYLPMTFGYAHFDLRGVGFSTVPALQPGIPARGVVGGAGMAVSSRTAHPTLALEFARFCSSAATQRDWWPNGGGQGAHRAAWDHLAAQHPFYRDTREAMARGVLRPRSVGFHHEQIRLGNAIEQWLHGGCPTAPPPYPSLTPMQCAAL